MKNLKRKLRGLPLVTPSPELDDRVLAQKPERPMLPYPVQRRVSLCAAAAVGLAMGVMGFVAGVAWRSGKPPPHRDSRSAVIVHVIHHPATSGNPFDFTRPSHFLPARDLEVTTRKLERKI